MAFTCRNTANAALRAGKIERQGCKVCGEPAHMHHEDYTKPLEVVWLCRQHHEDEHHKTAPSASQLTMHDLALKYAAEYL